MNSKYYSTNSVNSGEQLRIVKNSDGKSDECICTGWDGIFPLRRIDAYQDKLKGVSNSVFFNSVFTTAKA